MWIFDECIDLDKGAIQALKINEIYKWDEENGIFHVAAMISADTKRYGTAAFTKHIIQFATGKLPPKCQKIFANRQFPIRLIGQGEFIPQGTYFSNESSLPDFKIDLVLACSSYYQENLTD